MSPAFVSLAQGLYYFLTGAWPLVSIDTFQAVTGPKKDIWLVKTVGVLVAAIGAALGVAGLRRAVGVESLVLAVSSAGGLAVIDTAYSLKGRISRVYLLDAIAELVLIALWGMAWKTRRPAVKQRMSM